MSSIEQFMISTCTQTAVYWGNPVNNGFSKNTYDAPIEIACRWEGKTQLLKTYDAKGNIIEYIGVVYVLQDLDEDGCLFLGSLTDLTPEAYAEPEVMEQAFAIKQFEKLPGLRSTSQFLRKAYLTLWQYR
jgi:hypothetical protein